MTMKKKQDLLISIDGGATKSIIQIFTVDGKFLLENKIRAANIASNTHESWFSIKETLDNSLKQLDITPEDVNLYGGAGLAGAEVPVARENFRKLCTGFEKFIFETDAHTSCLGAHKGKNGAVIAIGTGTVAYAIFNDKHKKLSGWGFPQDDQGGGAWLGVQLISDMLQRIEGRKPETDLSRKLYNHLKRQGEDPMLWAVRAQPQKFGSLIPWLIEQAETGCSDASLFLDKAAEIISDLALALLKDEYADLPLCLLGGLANIFLSRLSPKVREHIIPAQGQSLDGAYYLALQAYENKELH